MLRPLALIALLLAGAGSAQAQTPTLHLHATLDQVSASVMKITTQGGAALTVGLTDATRFASVVAASLADVTPDSYVGCAALTRPDGSMQALEVHIFAPQMRGVGEGFHPWDAGPQSSMTNGAVGSVTGTAGRTIVIAYKGGEKTIDVPPDTPIVKLGSGTRALLVAGAHVTIFANKGADGSLVARYVTVGQNGLVPPM